MIRKNLPAVSLSFFLLSFLRLPNIPNKSEAFGDTSNPDWIIEWLLLCLLQSSLRVVSGCRSAEDQLGDLGKDREGRWTMRVAGEREGESVGKFWEERSEVLGMKYNNQGRK